MYGKIGEPAAFAGRGMSPRRIFGHDAIVIPKSYPDSRLLLGVLDKATLRLGDNTALAKQPNITLANSKTVFTREHAKAR